MAYKSDPFPPRLGMTAASPAMQAALVRVLETHWDPDGTIARALAARPEGRDPTRPRTLAEVARDAAGLLAAGGTESDVGGYLRREEWAVLPKPETEEEATARRQRRECTRQALWRTVRGIARPDDGAEPEEQSD